MDIQVCIGSACHLRGSYDIIETLKKVIAQKGLEDQYRVKAAFCLGHCEKPVSAKVGDTVYSLNIDTVESFFDQIHKENVG